MLVVLLSLAPGAGAQSIYLDPDINYITSGVGSEFDLELWVDEDITSMRSFVYHVEFDVTKLDTVSVVQGPLMPSANGVAATQFGKYIEDGLLKIQDLLLGAGLEVSGPGLLATIRLRVLDTGFVNLAPVFHRIRDVNANLLETDAYGTAIYADVVPDQFDLTSPIGGVSLWRLPGNPIPFSWTPSASVYPGENVTYTLDISDASDFVSGTTTSVPGLTGTSHDVDAGDLIYGYEGIYYWRVTATGDLYGFERLATPDYESFDFTYTPTTPSAFDLIAPLSGTEFFSIAEIDFDWEDATTPVPLDAITYTLRVSSDPAVETDVIVESPAASSALTVPVAGLPRNQVLYWNIAATNTQSLTRMSSSVYSFELAGCCEQRVGDVNGSGVDEPTIGDVSALIDARFINNNWSIIPCLAEADINQSGGLEPEILDITIGDISMLIDYLFVTGPQKMSLPDCL
jgi:hypothetical protein